MVALNGNSYGQKCFAEVSRLHLSSLKAVQNNRYLVGAPALYIAESIAALQQQDQRFITRVPMTLKEAKQAVLTLKPSALDDMGDGYSG